MCARSNFSTNYHASTPDMSDNNHITHPFLRLADSNAPYRDALVEAGRRVIDSGYYIGGPEVSALESDMASLCHTSQCVAVSNGLDALRLIFRAYIAMGRLSPGDEVLFPDMTFIASALAISDCGLIPVPVDASPETLNMDTTLLEAAVTSRTRAILTVHLYGRVCYDTTLADVARRHGLIVIEDAAQAIGADSLVAGPAGTTRPGSLGNAAAFSFYPTKNIGALGDAGAVTSSDTLLIRTVRTLANYGYHEHYNSVMQGFNCRMDALQAAFLRVKLPYTADENALRRRQAELYDRLITNSAIRKPLPCNFCDNSNIYYQYPVLVEDRRAFRNHLLEHGIETAVHYPKPVHAQPCYPDLNAVRYPIAQHIADSEVSLPIGRTSSLDAIPEIAAAINTCRPA